MPTHVLAILSSALCFHHALLGQDVFPLRPSEAQPNPSTRTATADGGPRKDEAPEPKAVTVAAPKEDVAPPQEVAGPVGVQEYVIASGDSLTRVAATAYGRAGYWRLLKLYNDCDPAKLKIGQVIRAPDLAWLLEEEGIVPLFKDASEAMLEGRALFLEFEQLIEDGATLEDESAQAKIKAAQEQLSRARALFSTSRKGVKQLPNSTLLQLRTAGELMTEVAQAPATAKAKMAQVHERFGNALTYCVIWARDGFN